VRAAWIGVMLAGCFDPRVSPGGECTPAGECPAGLECIGGVCLVPGTGGDPDAPFDAPELVPPDAVVDARPDAMVDARPPDAFVDPNLIAHWKLDDPPTDGVLDSSGRGHHGTCTNCPILVPGIVDGSYRFDAINDHITLPDHPDFRGNVTVAAWVWCDAVNLQIAALSKVLGTSGNSWQLEVMNTQHFSFSGGSVHYLDGGAAISIDAWHHVAGTWDGTTKRLYVDGLLLASVAATISYDTGEILIGADNNGGTILYYWDGKLDEIRVYNRALSAAEIGTLANP
jgi:hypothetical protein